jgi:hypothetical protein
MQRHTLLAIAAIALASCQNTTQPGGLAVPTEATQFAVIASGDGPRGNLLMGNIDIDYSSCALIKALAASAVGAPMRERGWLQLY